MWLLSLKIALRPNKRFLLAVLGVAICVMYISGSSAFVGGLKDSRERLLQEENNSYFFCTKDVDVSKSLFTEEERGEMGNTEAFWGVMTPVSFSNVSTYMLGFSDPLLLIAANPELENYSGILVGPMLVDKIDNETLSLDSMSGTEQAFVEGFYESSLFPPDWIVASPVFVRDAGGLPDGGYSFFITQNLSGMDEEGLVVQQLASKQGFFVEGVEQVESDLWLLSTISGVIAIIVVYTLMQVEILARKGDIKVLQGIGGGRGWIVGVFTLEAAVAAVIGGFLGVILGIVAVSYTHLRAHET